MQSTTFFTGQDALMRHQGRQLCYQAHIVNFRRDFTEIATRLPRLPDDTDIVIIRKEDVDLSRHVDFTVRRAKVKAAKIAHDPSYTDLIIDHDVLSQLPENGSVADRIPTCRTSKGQQDGGAMPVGPGAAAADGVGAGEDEQVVGGVMDLGNQERPEVSATWCCAGHCRNAL
jgi:hypothetical protein